MIKQKAGILSQTPHLKIYTDCLNLASFVQGGGEYHATFLLPPGFVGDEFENDRAASKKENPLLL